MKSVASVNIILLISFLRIEFLNTQLIGRIANVSLHGSSPYFINGTCERCVCEMVNSFNKSIVSLNCFPNIQRCELFLNYSPSVTYLMRANVNASFHFLQLPPNRPSISSPPVTTVPSRIVRYAYWTFDNTFSDLYGVYNAVPLSSANFSTAVGINGYGRALSVLRASSQYVQVASPGFSLINESFTIEAWVNPGSGMTSNDFLIFAQCDDTTSASHNRCLNAILRYGQPLISFYFGGDCGATRNVTMHQWSHVAFVHDFDLRTQSIYNDGLLTCFLNGSSLYIGPSTAPLRMGGCPQLRMFFNGLIDEVSLITRAKSASEILEDATLTFRYNFDAGVESLDSGQSLLSTHSHSSLRITGPLRINGTMINATSSSNGRFGQAISFNQSTSYFQTSGLVLFGTTTYPYTITMWIYPYSTTVGTLLMAWSGGWCLPVLGFTSGGTLHARHRSSSTVVSSVNTTTVIVLNTWTHVALTWANTTGLRLHINGALVGSSSVTTFNSSGSPMNFGLGGCVNSTLCSCPSGSTNMGQYLGMVDDFRLYSRALNASEISGLMNS